MGAALWGRGGKLVLKVQQSRVQLFYVHANFALSSRGNTESCKRKSACGSKSVRLWAETERERVSRGRYRVRGSAFNKEVLTPQR